MPPAIRKRLGVNYNGWVLYNAGFRKEDGGYSQNFQRDSIELGILLQDEVVLHDQLEVASLNQARQIDPKTGAEPGKYHHQIPGVTIRGLSTDYNACDNNAWTLLGYAEYFRLTQDRDFIKRHEPGIRRGIDEYILQHLNRDFLFIEDPRFSGAQRFALKVTYWKDSVLPQRKAGEPIYPVVYPLVHAQYIAALRKTALLIGPPGLFDIADRMSKSLGVLFNKDLGAFNIALDCAGPISGVSSDSLNMFFFLEPEDLDPQQIACIIRASEILETPAGYRGLSPKLSETIEDRYHADKVWPVEQATIHKGAVKFKAWASSQRKEELVGLLDHVEEVSSRAIAHLDGSYAETLSINDDEVQKAGCDPHLYTFAAKEYFRRVL